MSSIFFRIEVYGVDNYGCPEMDLMGYDDIDKLLIDCWDKMNALSLNDVNANHGMEEEN